MNLLPLIINSWTILYDYGWISEGCGNITTLSLESLQSFKDWNEDSVNVKITLYRNKEYYHKIIANYNI